MKDKQSYCGDCDGYLYDYCTECFIREKQKKKEQNKSEKENDPHTI